MSTLRDTLGATGDNASRTDERLLGQPSTTSGDFDAADFFARFDTPEPGDAVGAHHLFTSLGGGMQTGMERNAALADKRHVRFADGRIMTVHGAARHFAAKIKKAAGVYSVKAAGVFTTDQLAPRPDEALARTGRELRLGDGATGRALIDQQFGALGVGVADTNTLDDFRGLGKLAALRRFGGA